VPRQIVRRFGDLDSFGGTSAIQIQIGIQLKPRIICLCTRLLRRSFLRNVFAAAVVPHSSAYALECRFRRKVRFAFRHYEIARQNLHLTLHRS